jgi:endonuclease/exonuclease/phosphatase family metal-dependent hydrolase
MGYIIGSLNARHFSGLGSHDISKMADIINAEKFDIIALQEVKSQRPIDWLKARLHGWEGYHGKSQSDNDYGINHEGRGTGLGFAYLWNMQRVRECSNDGQPEIITRFSSHITRKPFYGRFTPAGLGGPFCEFRLINIHLWHGENKVIGTPQRLKEFETVTTEIYNYLSNRRYGDYMQAFTIVLGDYNFSAVYCEAYKEATVRYYIKTVQEKTTTLTKPESENPGFVSNYDHFSYDERKFFATKIVYDRVDSVSKYLNEDFTKHWKEVSDHVPIKIELILNPMEVTR